MGKGWNYIAILEKIQIKFTDKIQLPDPAGM